MKAKVLKYGVYPRQNDIVSRLLDLDRVNDKVFTCLDEKSDFSRDQDRISVVINLDGVYFEEGSYPRHTIEREDFEAVATRYADNFFGMVEGILADGGHLKLLFVKVYEALGRDTASLLAYRARREESQKQKADEELQRRVQQREQREAEERRRLEDVKGTFLLGEKIRTADFLTLAKGAGIAIHPHTLRVFHLHVTGVSRNGTLSVSAPNIKDVTVSGCFDALNNFIDKITNTAAGN